MKVLTFAKGKFIPSQDVLKQHLNSIGITDIKNLTDADLPESFKTEFSDILKYTRGYGYCIWKPYIILNELMNLKDDEVFLYIDSTDRPESLFFEILDEYFKDPNNTLLLVNRGYKHGDWTRRDTFVLMDCDDEKYHNHVQLEAGVVALKKTDFNIKLIEEWFNYCKNIHILTEIPNTQGKPNLQGFREHRYDQSILTNLSIKYNLKSFRYHDMVIKYNYYQPAIYS
jgi:hypothetical protein